MPKIGETEFNELLDLYVRGHRTRGTEPGEARVLRGRLDRRLLAIYSADRFPSLHEILACDITPKSLDDLLLPLPPASRDLTLRQSVPE